MAYFNGREILLAGLKGKQGEPGLSPYIGANGNWFVGTEDTGVLAGVMTEADKQQIADVVAKQLGAIMGTYPTATEADNDRILQVVDGTPKFVDVSESSIATFIDNYINEALGGEF